MNVDVMPNSIMEMSIVIKCLCFLLLLVSGLLSLLVVVPLPLLLALLFGLVRCLSLEGDVIVAITADYVELCLVHQLLTNAAIAKLTALMRLYPL